MKTLYKTMPLVGTNNEGREHALLDKVGGEKSPTRSPNYSSS